MSQAASPDSAIVHELRDGVAVLRLDDGKANALSHGLIQGLNEHLDAAEKNANAVLVVGRPGRFSGGFDLATMRSGPEAARALVTAGAELFLRIYEYPRPVVMACTGHAVAAGAIALLTADYRVGAEGEFTIGLSEVGIGMTLPTFAIEFARQRISRRHFTRATSQAELYSPEACIDAGYLDRVVSADALFDAALAEATRLAALPQPAFANTKKSAHATAIAYIRETLDEDMRRITGPAT